MKKHSKCKKILNNYCFYKNKSQYTNLQLLKAEDNLKKSNNLNWFLK